MQERANRRRWAGTRKLDGMVLQGVSVLMAGAAEPGLVKEQGKCCLRCPLKTGSVEAEETLVGRLFQTRDVLDEKDVEVAIDVFLNGVDMVTDEEEQYCPLSKATSTLYWG